MVGSVRLPRVIGRLPLNPRNAGKPSGARNNFGIEALTAPIRSKEKRKMKKLMMLMVIALAAASAAFGQTKSKDVGDSVETQLIKLEKQAWEAWKNKNRDFVQSYLADEAFFVYGDGVTDKSQIVKSFGACEIKSYSLEDFRFLMLDKNSALLSYVAVQDSACAGKPQPPKVRSSSVYVKRDGKWRCA
jgi:hypothetical protein